MKRLLVLILIFLLLLLLPACAASQQTDSDAELSAQELYALRQEMEDAYKKQYGYTTAPDFVYYTSANGNHIVSWQTMLGVASSVKIADYTFSFYSGFQLMAYKNGMFTDLQETFLQGEVSNDDIAKAYHAYEKRKQDEVRWHYKKLYENEYGPVDDFRVYGAENEYYILYAVKKDAASVASTITIAESQFQFSKEASLYAAKPDAIISLEVAYNTGCVSKEAIAYAAQLHTEYENKE